MNCVQDMKHCCWYVFFHVLLSFTFLTRASKQNRHCWVCLPRAAVCTKLSNPVYWWPLFLVHRIGATAGPPLPFVQRDTEGNQVFFWGVICLPFREWEPSPGLLSFCTSCSYCRCKVCRRVLPRSLGWGPGLVWMHRHATRGQQGEEKLAPASSALWQCLKQSLQLGCRGAASPRHSGVPVTRRTCRRIICTWSCDNTNVDFFFLQVIGNVCKVSFIFL